MKAIIIVCAIVVAGALGYILEPGFRPMLTGKSANLKPKDAGNTEPITIDPNSLTPEQLPKYVIIKKQSQFTDSSSGVTVQIAAETLAKVIEVNGVNVAVKPEDTEYVIELPITSTNLTQQIKNNPPKLAPVVKNDPPAAPPVTTPAPVTPDPDTIASTDPSMETPPSMPVTPPVTPDPDTIASTDPSMETPPSTPVTPPVPEMQPTPTPTPTPQPEITVSNPVATDAIVSLMKTSIANQQIKEFSSDQVTDWQPSENQIFDGVSYQTGMAFYNTETLFGTSTLKAKALIRDGKVERWIWPQTDIEIK